MKPAYSKKPTGVGLLACLGGQGLLTANRSLCQSLKCEQQTGGKILTTAKILRKCKNMAQPHLFLTRPMQNLSVRRKASLFCLHLKRRSKPIPQLSLKGIIGAGLCTKRNDAEPSHCAAAGSPCGYTLAPLSIRCKGLITLTGRVFFTLKLPLHH